MTPNPKAKLSQALEHINAAYAENEPSMAQSLVTKAMANLDAAYQEFSKVEANRRAVEMNLTPVYE